MKIKNKILFILGGEGLIGNSVVDYYLAKNWIIYSFDLNKSRNRKHKNYNFYKINLENLDNLILLLKSFFAKKIYPDSFINSSYPRTSDWAKNNFKEIEYDTFSKNIDLQLKSSCWISKIIADEMMKNNIKGSIILIASMYGIVAHDNSVYEGTDMKENFTYTLVKGGIISSVRSLAAYYGKFNVRINALSPGAIQGHVAGNNKPQPNSFIKNFKSRVPLRRLAQPSEIAKIIFFLGSDESDYITGANIVADGGWTII